MTNYADALRNAFDDSKWNLDNVARSEEELSTNVNPTNRRTEDTDAVSVQEVEGEWFVWDNEWDEFVQDTPFASRGLAEREAWRIIAERYGNMTDPETNSRKTYEQLRAELAIGDQPPTP